MQKIIDSPILWSGKKTKLLPQIKPLFPDTKVFIDIFGGSGSVSVNSDSEIILYNDLFLGNLLKTIYETDILDILNHVDDRIKEYNLTKIDKNNYYNFKKYIVDTIDRSEKYYLDLFTISLFAFNGSLEFNMQKGLTSSFGKRNRRKVVENILFKFKEKLDSLNKIKFYEKDYIDFTNMIINSLENTNEISKSDLFFYADCPYSITRINGYKSNYNDEALFELLDKLNRLGFKFAMSNVLEHKGKLNHKLKEWSDKYNVIHLNFDYNNLNNTMKGEMEKSRNHVTDEVLITNYKIK